jgi:DNA-binding NarL/FixJ family response regulator
MLSVIIADDHDLLRRGLREVLVEGLGDGVEFGEARNAGEAIQLLVEREWDLLLLDINMPGRGGLEVLEEAVRLWPGMPVVILTAYPEREFALRAFRMGASGYLSKHEAADQLMTAVKRVLAGGKYVPDGVAQRLACSLDSSAEREPHESLTQRELQVLRLVALGESLKEIGAELGLSEKTVAVYRRRIADKAGLKTEVEMARYALKHGLVD